jgi:hypothetical protein
MNQVFFCIRLFARREVLSACVSAARYLRIVFMVVNVLVYLGNLSLLVKIKTTISGFFFVSNLAGKQTYMVIICEAIQQDKRSGRPADLAKVDTLKLIDRIDNYYFCGLYIITCGMRFLFDLFLRLTLLLLLLNM